jgi:APA family basic amino acid/polyamine antiporter
MGTEKSNRLRRVLGVGFGLAVSVGATIGVGILRTPGLVAGQVHTPYTILFLWAAAGLYTLLGASCLTELGTMLPQDGGYYVYVRHAFGNTVGFAVGWTDWLTYCSVLAYISIAIAEFIAVLVPPVSPINRDLNPYSCCGTAVDGNPRQQSVSRDDDIA